MQSNKIILKKPSVVALLILIIGVAVLTAGFLASSQRSPKINTGWQTVGGLVTDIATEYQTNSAATYSTVVNYTVNGKVYKLNITPTSSSSPATGTLLQVAYNPLNPSESLIETKNNQTSPFIYALYVIGVLIIAAAITIFLRLGRTQNLPRTVLSRPDFNASAYSPSPPMPPVEIHGAKQYTEDHSQEQSLGQF